MSYVVVRPVYGDPVAHQPSCWTLNNRASNPTVETLPAGAVLCIHCHGVPSEREPEWEEDGFIIIRDVHFPKKPAIAHHPLCRSLTTRYMGGARWNHRRVQEIPPTAKICGQCHCEPPRPRTVSANGKLRITRAKPVGKYYLLDRKGAQKGPRYEPVCCPVCSGKALDRAPGSRLWMCASCLWEGQVVTKTWERVERPRVQSTEGGQGAAVMHRPPGGPRGFESWDLLG